MTLMRIFDKYVPPLVRCMFMSCMARCICVWHRHFVDNSFYAIKRILKYGIGMTIILCWLMPYIIQEILSTLTGRIPPRTKHTIQHLLTQYSSNLTSVLCQFPGHQVIETSLECRLQCTVVGLLFRLKTWLTRLLKTCVVESMTFSSWTWWESYNLLRGRNETERCINQAMIAFCSQGIEKESGVIWRMSFCRFSKSIWEWRECSTMVPWVVLWLFSTDSVIAVILSQATTMLVSRSYETVTRTIWLPLCLPSCLTNRWHRRLHLL